MALIPPVAEDLMGLLDQHPDVTLVQKCSLKSAAAYLVQDEEERLGRETEFNDYDPGQVERRLDCRSALFFNFVSDRAAFAFASACT